MFIVHCMKGLIIFGIIIMYMHGIKYDQWCGITASHPVIHDYLYIVDVQTLEQRCLMLN